MFSGWRHLHNLISYQFFKARLLTAPLFPMESFFLNEPKVSISLWFIQDVHYVVTKIGTQIFKMFFPNYSCLRKGKEKKEKEMRYRFYCPSLNRYLVSIHVFFSFLRIFLISCFLCQLMLRYSLVNVNDGFFFSIRSIGQ